MTINNIVIDIIRKNIKNIHLGVYPPDGRVRMAVPFNVSEETVRLFAISKLGWIRQNKRKFDDQERIPQLEFKDRESHYFLGQRYMLRVIEKEAASKVILGSKKYIDLYVREGAPLQKLQKIMNEWYRSELKKLIPGYIEKWNKIIQVRVDGWQIKQMKTKWGFL